MTKLATKYICRECGTWHGKWNGKCEGCFAWNSLIEEVVAAKPATFPAAPRPRFPLRVPPK